ncbi:MAG: helix-turn-helix domain-containing protein [Pseudohongiellaceae bacterium]
MPRVSVKPELLHWARERAGRSVEDLHGRFKNLAAWEQGESQPTFKQLEDFAKATHVPFGYLFLPEPPEERIPMPDLRTVKNEEISRPSPDLLDTIYLMQRRQAWLREEMIDCESEPLDLVGSVHIADDAEGVGRKMRQVLGLNDNWAEAISTWSSAVRKLLSSIEELGVMAFINGIVNNSTNRKLNVLEFRGFALSDKYAPLVFVNGADAKSAQMFTLAHELAHILLGKSALSNTGLASQQAQGIELWCDLVAAEFLVPAEHLRERWPEFKNKEDPFSSISRIFKVSPIVVGRRAKDLRLIDDETFFNFYEEYIARDHDSSTDSKGGNFYYNQNTRVGKKFYTQIIHAATAGRLSFKEAYRLTGLNGNAFQKYGQFLEINLP